VLSAAVGGACVMAVELLGARMLSSCYGNSLTAWGSMIAVTLLSLAAGYLVGGWLADRSASARPVWLVVLSAAALIAVLPQAGAVLRVCRDVCGLRGGALVGSTLVFSLPLGLLGMIGPFVIRALARDLSGLGMTAGGVLAVSTLGSVAGTLLSAFWLIPRLGVSSGFRVTAAVAAGAGLVGLLLCAGRRGIPSVAVLLWVFLLPSGATKPGLSFVAPDGTRMLVEALRDSRYGRIAVLRKGAYRLLVVDGIVQTGLAVDATAMSERAYLLDRYHQALIPYAFENPNERSALVIGLAGGLTPRLLRRHGMAVASVELDPAVIAVAREWFGFDGAVVAADGRGFVESSETCYDVCVLDAYAGDAMPAHLFTVEAFRAMARRLAPDGLLVVNFIGAPGGDAFASVRRTLEAVFAETLALRTEPGEDVQPITIFAAHRAIVFNGEWRRELDGFAGIDPVSDALVRLRIAPPRGRGRILSDDHNPLDTIRAAEALRWRERSAENLGDIGLL